ncbi:hypothetical protein L3H42_11385, partial [Corynebacterium sp. MC-13]|nr:hypothetical protein [Corynebacterium parakroppenstedtii]
MELLKDYDVDILYHPGKANVVADALSRKSMGSLADTPPEKREIVRDIQQLSSLGVRLSDSGDSGVSICRMADSSLIAEVKQRQYEDPVLVRYRNMAREKVHTSFEFSPDGTLLYTGRLCIPDVSGLRQQILGEAHCARFFVHPGSMKMYHDLKCG